MDSCHQAGANVLLTGTCYKHSHSIITPILGMAVLPAHLAVGTLSPL